MDSLLRIKIKTLDNSLYEIEILRENTIIELKSKIETEFKIPIQRQRLIFQGKLLNNSEKISSYKIEDGHVLHLIAQANNINEQTNFNSNFNNNINNNMSSNSQLYFGNNNLNNLNQTTNFPDLDTLSAISRPHNHTSTQRRNIRRRLIQQRANGFSSNNLNESKEVLRQNLTTVQQLLSSFVNINELISSESYNIFNYQSRKLQIGQWIDVKEGNDQWFEAQVVNTNTTQALVHYYYISNKPDEWIDMNSQRIAPFKTYTSQSANSSFLSPTFSSNVQENERKNINYNFDLYDFLYEFGLTLSQIFGYVLNINMKADRSEKSDPGVIIKNHEINDFDMKSLINGMIEEQKQNDVNKGLKTEYDLASLKSLKSLEKNSIDYDASSMKSIRSYISNSNWSNFQAPTTFQGYISEEVEEESQEREEEVSDYQSSAPGPSIQATRELETYLIASQVAPLLDRMGRLMIDISPHLAMYGANLQNQFPNFPNAHNISNISIMTNEGSTISGNQMFSAANNTANNNNNNNNYNNNNNNGRQFFFQVPIMLTPSEIMSNVQNNYQENIDIHIHAYVNPNQISNMGINNNPPPEQNSQASNNIINTNFTNTVSTQTIETKNIAVNTDEEVNSPSPYFRIEEEKINTNNPKKIKEIKESKEKKFNYFPKFTPENFSPSNLIHPEFNRLYREAENGDHKDKEIQPRHVSFKGLRKVEDKNRIQSIKPVKSKFMGPGAREEKEGKKNDTKLFANNTLIEFSGNSPITNSSVPPNNQNNQGSQMTNNDNSNNTNNNNNTTNSNKDSKTSNCGRQIY